MDPLSKSQEEARKADQEHLEHARKVFSEMSAIMNSAGFLEFEKMLIADRERFQEIAEHDFDSVLDPTPLKALAVRQYIQTLLDTINNYRSNSQ